MASSFTVNDRAFKSALKRMQDRIDAATKEAIKENDRMLVSLARSKVKVDSGHLKNSIVAEKVERSGKTGWRSFVHASAIYAPKIERKEPFMQPAIEQMRPIAQRNIQRHWQRAMH